MLVSIFIPISEQYGVNDWIIAFIILSLSDTWIFSYQSTYYTVFLENTESVGFYSQRNIAFFSGILMFIVKVVGLIISTFYWKYIGIL